VRNLAYEKHVAVRFTLDDWRTTNEVSARHVMSLPCLPLQLVPKTFGDVIAGTGVGTGQDLEQKDEKEKEKGAIWDRFAFTIRLQDYAGVNEKVLWLVARFATGGGGEWWDNNNGGNYHVAFRAATATPAPPHASPDNIGAGVDAPGTFSFSPHFSPNNLPLFPQ
jgi:hypothetical protein